MSRTKFFEKKKKREKRKLFSLYSCANCTSKCVREKKKNAMTSRNPGDKNSMQLRTRQKTRRRIRTRTTTQETFATEMVNLSTYRGN